MRARKPVVYGAPDVPAAIRVYAENVGADLRLSGRDFGFNQNSDVARCWDWRGRNTQFSRLDRPALAGDMQLQNAAAVLALVEALGLNDTLDARLLNRSFAGLKLPGRLQWIDRRPRWLLDVAHNAAASTVLAASIVDVAPHSSVVGIVGMLQDKDIAAWVSPLRELVDFWIAVTVDGNRAMQAPVLARDIANHSGSPCLIATSLNDAMLYARSRVGQNDLILVSGSFYIVGSALAALDAGGSL